MAAFITVGETLVDHDALQDQLQRGSWQDFERDVFSGKDRTFDIGGRSLRSADISAAVPIPGAATANAGPPDFTPIGIGQPLSIEILTIYVGDKPGRRAADLLAVSGIRSVETHDAAPRAVNQLMKDVADRQLLLPSAFGDGSPIVYYSPALIDGTVLVSLELVADSFNENVFQQIGQLFTAAAGMPVFAPAASVLMAGSTIIGMVEKLGKALESDAFMKANIPLRFDTPGFPVSSARHVVLCNDSHYNELSGLNVKVIQSAGRSRAELVDENTGASYHGNAPYIIASLDGRERNTLKEFSAALASAAVLERFYGTVDTLGTVVEVLRQALTFYNDFKFRDKAEDLMNALAAMNPDDPRLAQTKTLIDAYNENIQTLDLKVKAQGQQLTA